jgi:hypothetical protein
MQRRTFQLAALALALVGYWLPWLTHPDAALRLNGYELSEWVTYLPGVRAGSLPVSRLLFLLPLACLAILLGLAATWQATRPVAVLTVTAGPAHTGPRSGVNALLPTIQGLGGWALLVLAAVCAFTVFPPYPYLLTAYADPEYRAQLFSAALVVIVLLLALYLPTDFKAAVQIALAALGGGLAVWGLLAVWPTASSLLGATWPLGLGWPATVLGFAGLLLGGLRELFGPRI